MKPKHVELHIVLALLAHITGVSAMKVLSVKTVDWSTMGANDANFAKTIAGLKVPVVVKNAASKDWKALQDWTLDSLKQQVDERARFMVKNSTSRRFGWGCCEQTRMTMNEIVNKVEASQQYKHQPDGKPAEPIVADASVFGIGNDDDDDESKPSAVEDVEVTIDEADQGIREYVYFSAPLSSLGPNLRRQVDEKNLQLNELDGVRDDWVEAKHQTTVWMGSKGAITPLHIDLMHNFFVQVRGRKKFTLFAPSLWRHLYLYPRGHLLDRNVQLDIANVDLQKYPLFDDISERFEATLEEGDVLYIPPMYFHQVEALDPSISINSWSPSAPQEKVHGAWSVGIPLDPKAEPDALVYQAGALLAFVIRRVVGDEAALMFTFEMIECRYAKVFADKAYTSTGSSKSLESQAFEKYLADLEADSPAFLDSFDAFEAACDEDRAGELLPQDAMSKIQKTSSELANHFVGAGLDPGSRSLHVANYVEDLAAQVVGNRRVLPFLRSCVFPRVQGKLRRKENQKEEFDYGPEREDL